MKIEIEETTTTKRKINVTFPIYVNPKPERYGKIIGVDEWIEIGIREGRPQVYHWHFEGREIATMVKCNQITEDDWQDAVRKLKVISDKWFSEHLIPSKEEVERA